MTTITSLPEVATSNLRELQWLVDWLARKYAEAGLQSEVAWKMYNDAIDNDNPKDEINMLFEMAEMFDGICKETWAAWQESKRQYLAILN